MISTPPPPFLASDLIVIHLHCTCYPSPPHNIHPLSFHDSYPSHVNPLLPFPRHHHENSLICPSDSLRILIARCPQKNNSTKRTAKTNSNCSMRNLFVGSCWMAVASGMMSIAWRDCRTVGIGVAVVPAAAAEFSSGL